MQFHGLDQVRMRVVELEGAKFEEGSGDCLGPPARFRAGPDGGSAPRKSPVILGLQIMHFRVKFTFPAGTIAAV